MVQNIRLMAKDAEGIFFDLKALKNKLSQIPDTRQEKGKIYPLEFVLSAIILAKLAGEDKPYGISEWIKLRCSALISLFGYELERVPCLNTIRTILSQVLSLEELQKRLGQFLHEAFGGQQSQLIAIDGKTLRGTIPKGEKQGVHLIGAYLPEEGIVLGQMKVDKKENEIVVAPQLLQSLDLRNKVVCGDAMHTQRALSVQILAQGGDYIWFVKNNQPSLLDDVQQFFTPPRKAPGWSSPPLARSVVETVQSGHGRVDKRRLTVIEDDQGFLDWPSVSQVFKLERIVHKLACDQPSHETVYGIVSFDADKYANEQLLEWTQAYWGIENGLHYRRDVTLKEDATRMSHDHLAEAIAVINNFIVGLASKLGYRNLASARRSFDAHLSFQLASPPHY